LIVARVTGKTPRIRATTEGCKGKASVEIRSSLFYATTFVVQPYAILLRVGRETSCAIDAGVTLLTLDYGRPSRWAGEARPHECEYAPKKDDKL
jgi:hypothetical protein